MESDLYGPILLALSRAGARVFRNNVGQARYKGGHVVRYGLAPGSADLIGWTPDGRFLALEVKTPRGRLSAQQAAFLDAVRAAGGVAACVRSADEALAALNPVASTLETLTDRKTSSASSR
jgi:hypothetical protein